MSVIWSTEPQKYTPQKAYLDCLDRLLFRIIKLTGDGYGDCLKRIVFFSTMSHMLVNEDAMLVRPPHPLPGWLVLSSRPQLTARHPRILTALSLQGSLLLHGVFFLFPFCFFHYVSDRFGSYAEKELPQHLLIIPSEHLANYLYARVVQERL